MFCPSCGTEYTIELKYCNRCGANLSANLVVPEPVNVNVTKPTLIIGIVILLVTLGGFGAVVGAANGLAHVLQGNDPLMAIIMFGMLTIMVVDVFLIRLLTKLITATLPSKSAPHGQMHGYVPTNAPPQLQSPMTGRLAGAPSVTEGTTRFFDQYTPSTPAEPVPVKKRVDK